MRENLEIVRASKELIPEIVELVNTSLKDDYLIPSIYRGSGIVKYLENEFDNPNSLYYYFVVKHENKIIGYCELKSFFPDIFLNMIAVDKSSMSSGVGTFMMNYITSFFKDLNYGAILLDVFESNEVAREWYRKRNFKVVASQFFVKSKICNGNKNILSYIMNLPQVKVEKEQYGFSIIKVQANNSIYEYGIINKTLVFRGGYNLDAIQIGHYLLNILQMDDLYFYSKNSMKETKGCIKEIDCIYRKKMIL